VQPISGADGVVTYGMTRSAGALLLAVWGALLVGAAWARSVTSYNDVWVQPLHWFESFYRVGSLIYGGGQVRCTVGADWAAWHV
jgi:chromate transporter